MRLRTVSVLFVFVLFLASMAFQEERSQSALAQSSTRKPPPIEWTKSYGVATWALSQMADGGYTLLGLNSTSEAWLIRTDVSGNMLWNKTYAPAPNTEMYQESLSGTATADGGYVVANSFRYHQTGIGGAWVVKTDALGNIEWNRTYGGEVSPGCARVYSFSSVCQTSDGGYALAGGKDSYSSELARAVIDFSLIKTDASGNVVWNRTYGEETSNEYAHSVERTSDGGYILAGETTSQGASWTDCWVMKTDQNGNMVWNKTWGATEGGDWFDCVRQTSDNGYLMAGCYNCRPYMLERADFWLVKIDSSGTAQWSKTYGEASRYESAHSALQTTDGNLIAAGGFVDGGFWYGWLVRTDSYGNVIWNGTYGTGAWTDVIQTSDGGYAFTGARTAGLTKIMRANPPVVSFTYSPTNASVQEEIAFNASASSDLDEDIVSYVWDFDDGNVSTVSGPIISHTYGSPRIYNVTLTVTDSEELNSSLSRVLWVRVPTYIEMSIVDWAFIGFEIPVSGRLSDMYGNFLKNENVTLQWYVGGSTWVILASDITDDFGNYIIEWKPATVRSHTVKVGWSGNQTFFPTQDIATISIVSIPTRISLALSSSTSFIGFQIGISGDLISDIRAVSNTPVLLSYSVTGGQTWNDMTLTITDLDGHYSAVWMPSATGNYILKASWAGNSTYPKASKTVNLAVIPFEERNVFSVISNSTVSELSFESVQRELTFTVEGPASTTGYADVYIAKSLIDDIEGVEVKLNGTEIDYTATSLDDSWLVHVTYQHRVHAVSVNLGALAVPTDGTIWIDPMGTALFIAVLAAGLIAAVVLTRRRRTERTRNTDKNPKDSL